jgi:hypothetical protein
MLPKMLKREVGIFGAVMMGLGSIIGTGAFVGLGIARITRLGYRYTATVILGGLITSTLCEFLIHPSSFRGSAARTPSKWPAVVATVAASGST